MLVLSGEGIDRSRARARADVAPAARRRRWRGVWWAPVQQAEALEHLRRRGERERESRSAAECDRRRRRAARFQGRGCRRLKPAKISLLARPSHALSLAPSLSHTHTPSRSHTRAVPNSRPLSTLGDTRFRAVQSNKRKKQRLTSPRRRRAPSFPPFPLFLSSQQHGRGGQKRSGRCRREGRRGRGGGQAATARGQGGGGYSSVFLSWKEGTRGTIDDRGRRTPIAAICFWDGRLPPSLSPN